MPVHVNDFAALVPAGTQPSQHTLLRAAHMLGHTDNEQLYIACEAPGCTTSVRVADAYSLAAVYRMPGRGIPGFQCSEEQHFGCSHEHAIEAMLHCLREHIEPAHRSMRTQAADTAGASAGAGAVVVDGTSVPGSVAERARTRAPRTPS